MFMYTDACVCMCLCVCVCVWQIPEFYVPLPYFSFVLRIKKNHKQYFIHVCEFIKRIQITKLKQLFLCLVYIIHTYVNTLPYTIS